MGIDTGSNVSPIGCRQEQLNDVVCLFAQLLGAAGATQSMIATAMSNALGNVADIRTKADFTALGMLQRDCMEVMCAWRRNSSFVDDDGNPRPLSQDDGPLSFRALCSLARCRGEWRKILQALDDFGAVTIDANHRVVSQTPTFLLARQQGGGRLATDGLLKQLEGYLRVVHHNVLSVSGLEKPRFERACTVSIAAELEPVFALLVRMRGQEFVDSIDEWLERNAKKKSATGQYVELGAGAYFIDQGRRT